MVENDMKECCRRALEGKLRTIRAGYTSFPVIKDLPCPVCREIIKVRVYEKPRESRT